MSAGPSPSGRFLPVMMSITIHRSELFNFKRWVISWYSDAKPDKRQQRVRQPVHPGKIADALAMIEMQIHPYIQKFVYAQPGQEIGSKAICLHVLPADVKVAFKRRNAPAERPLSQQSTGFPVKDSHVTILHRRISTLKLPTIDYPGATSTPRFMTTRSEMSLSVLSK